MKLFIVKQIYNMNINDYYYYCSVWIDVTYCKNVKKRLGYEINANRAKLAIDALGEPEERSTKRGHYKTVNIFILWWTEVWPR